MQQDLINCIADLDDVSGLLKSYFVGKDEMVEMIILCAIAQEHLLVVGPPGTAKSDLVKRFSLLCSETLKESETIPYFEYLLTQFTEPNEIFGPVDVKSFQEGNGYHRITNKMLPKAEIVFLDEVFKANSAILNALLTILNERIFYNGGRANDVSLLFAIGATNEVPKDPELNALYDRFLIRLWTDHVEEERFPELFRLGWKLESDRIKEGYKITHKPTTSTDKIKRIYRELDNVDLNPIENHYRELVRRIRSEGIHLSDRRVIKLLKLIAASALKNRRTKAESGDFWILRHVWNNPEQITILENILEPYVDDDTIANIRGSRDAKTIQQDLDNLQQNMEKLKSDIDFVDFLKQAERFRKEINRADLLDEKKSMLDQIKNMVNQVYEIIDKGQPDA
ncbi:AAA ATPase [Candidatus Magnetomorum sp. HK-1]|nr:AAA ATPase [Candidatus Magnetomorum sp. HK-1]